MAGTDDVVWVVDPDGAVGIAAYSGIAASAEQKGARDAGVAVGDDRAAFGAHRQPAGARAFAQRHDAQPPGHATHEGFLDAFQRIAATQFGPRPYPREGNGKLSK